MKAVKEIVWISVAAGLMVSSGLAGAQDPAPAAATTAVTAPAEQAPKLMTQGELAQLLVKKLGLYRIVPANPSDLECIGALVANGIFPSATLSGKGNGWNPTAEVAPMDVARLLVRALGLSGQIQDPANDQQWMDVLKTAEVSTETVGAGVSALRPFSEILTAVPLFQVTQDPLDKRYIPESDILNLFGSISFPVQSTIPVTEEKEEVKKPKPATPT
jgi:hypothetical protein